VNTDIKLIFQKVKGFFMTLRKYLSDNKLTMADFSIMLGVTRQAVYNYVNNKRTPKAKLAQKIIKLTDGKVRMKDLKKAVTKSNR